MEEERDGQHSRPGSLNQPKTSLQNVHDPAFIYIFYFEHTKHTFNILNWVLNALRHANLISGSNKISFCVTIFLKWEVYIKVF
jgi:hypothetical protein